MADEQSRNEIGFLVAWAGIKVPPERFDVLAAGLSGTRTQTDALAKYDYGVAELSSRFIPPAGQ